MNNLPNPTEGEIIEVYPGVFYQYSHSTNSWIRLNGYHSIKPATPVSAGLMTKEDYIKIEGLLKAPPKTRLSSNKCSATFEGGTIGFYSRDGSVLVEDYLDLYETGKTTREQWHIHEDTWGFNFRINLQFLIEEMKKRGNLISENMVGPKGLDGEKGPPGVNKLDTGPMGPDGLPGNNAPFAGTLVSNNLMVTDKSKAVVDVAVEEVSPEENYLVIYKGTIGPKNLCTKKVNVQNVQSTWLLVRRNKEVCGTGCQGNAVVSNCETAYLDIEVITDAITEYFNSLIMVVKQERETLVREWLKTMMYTFNDQKYALCCGLENCMSRKRNEDERRYIETQRIAAAAAGYKVLISDRTDGEDVPEPHTKIEVDMDKYKTCDGPGWQPTVVTPITPE